MKHFALFVHTSSHTPTFLSKCLNSKPATAFPKESSSRKHLFPSLHPILSKHSSYVPYTPEKDDITSCGIPTNYNASAEWADKKVVLFAVPGAFTPGCSVKHLPGYIEHLNEFKGKAVDVVAVLAFNDAWVMSAWGKANGIKGDDIVSPAKSVREGEAKC